MTKLRLAIATGNYDRNRPLVDGEVQIDGVDPVFMLLEPEEIFFRAFRHAEFDVSELSLSTFTVKCAQGDNPYVGVPVFPSRAFRHTSIYIRTDRGIRGPADLKGRRIGLGEYQLTANVWARAILEDEYGVPPSEITWVRGGVEQLGRVEKVSFELPPGVRLEAAPADRTLSQLLAEGAIDGLIGPRMPSCYAQGHPHVGWLFADPVTAASAWYRKTRIFPVMHVLGVKRELAGAHPWLPAALLKAFQRSKELCLARLADTSATKATLPFVEEQLKAARDLIGADYWSYGVEGNRAGLDYFLDHHHRQGLSARRVAVEELFHPSTFETARI